MTESGAEARGIRGGSPRMKTTATPRGRTRWVVLAIVAFAIAALFWFWLVRDRDRDDALRLYGNVDIREVELSFRQPGRVLSMSFDEGDTVTVGAVMARLEDTPYREQVIAAEAQVSAGPNWTNCVAATVGRISRRPRRRCGTRSSPSTSRSATSSARAPCSRREQSARARSMPHAPRTTRQPPTWLPRVRPCRSPRPDSAVRT